MTAQRPVIDAILSTLTDPVEAVEIVNLQLDHFDGILSQFGHVTLLAAAMLCGGKHDLAAALRLWDYVSNGMESTIDVRFGIVATAFKYVQATVPHTRDNMLPQTFGVAMCLMASWRFRKKFVGNDQNFADLGWNHDPYTMERLTSLPLAEFEVGRYHESGLPEDARASRYQEMLVLDAQVCGEAAMRTLLTRHVERLPEQPAHQLDLVVGLAGILLELGPYLQVKDQIKSWLRGERPGVHLSRRRLQAVGSAIAVLNDFDTKARGELMLDLANSTYRDLRLGLLDRFNLDIDLPGMMMPADLDPDDLISWRRYNFVT